MTTPARRHQQRVLAAQASAAAPHGGQVQGSVHELMLAQLYEHRLRLKSIQSIERKIEAKRVFVPLYDAYIDGALDGGVGAQDIVLTSLMVWHIDIGSFDRALQIGSYALQHQLSLPDQYDRDIATLLIDEFSGAALAGKVPADQALQILSAVAEMTADYDAPDQARAKLHKAIGYALVGKSGPTDIDYSKLDFEPAKEALPHLHRALELFENVGVKKDIERLERRLKDAPPVS